MKLHDSFVRRQLEVMSGVADKVTLSTARKAQDAAGSLIRFTHRNEVVEHEREKNGMRAVLTVPRDELRGGIILYLHGGGFVSGDMDDINHLPLPVFLQLKSLPLTLLSDVPAPLCLPLPALFSPQGYADK